MSTAQVFSFNSCLGKYNSWKCIASEFELCKKIVCKANFSVFKSLVQKCVHGNKPLAFTYSGEGAIITLTSPDLTSQCCRGHWPGNHSTKSVCWAWWSEWPGGGRKACPIYTWIFEWKTWPGLGCYFKRHLSYDLRCEVCVCFCVDTGSCIVYFNFHFVSWLLSELILSIASLPALPWPTVERRCDRAM